MTGLRGAGKTTIAGLLQKKGFAYLTIPHFIADEELPLDKLNPEMNYVIEEITDVDQIDSFKEKDDVLLIRIDAPPEIRIERLTERQKSQNGKEGSYDEVLAFERNLLEDEDISKQQLAPVFRMANVVIKNDSDFETLQKKVERMIEDLSKKFVFKKPSDDGFFMEIAQVAAKRSRCSKRKVGAVLAKNKQILALGFDDTPRHVKHCNENGCPGCAKQELNLPCICAHAEENLIAQAAYHGLSTQETSIYTTESPCLRCTQIIINAGIKEVIFNQDAPLNEMTYALFKEANITLKPRKIDVSL